MNTQRTLCAAIVLVVAFVLVVPSDGWAVKNVYKVRPVVFDESDPEVPDVVTPDRQRYSGSNRSSAFDEVTADRSRQASAVREESWYERVLRLLRALTLGGRVR